MLDVVALGELLIDFTYQNADEFGYPIMAAHPFDREEIEKRMML